VLSALHEEDAKMAYLSNRLARFVAASALGVGLSFAGTSTDAFEQTKASDQVLKDKIERRLLTDAGIGKYDIRVKVDEGDVTLEGTVATEAQRADAARIARLAGVDDVDNDLKVDKDADQVLSNRAAKGLRRTGEAISDAWITTKVQWFFIGEDALDGSKIKVDTERRVVTLDGKVKSAEARARANELANMVDGVTKVVDKLEVDRD
jgi:hyperosmotically inducible periplasmic protein